MEHLALMVACVALMVGSAFAQGTDVPGDSNGDKIVSADDGGSSRDACAGGKAFYRGSAGDQAHPREVSYQHHRLCERTVTIYKPVEGIVLLNTYSYEPHIHSGTRG